MVLRFEFNALYLLSQSQEPMSLLSQVSQLTSAADELAQNGAPVREWACPVPWLGDLGAAHVATVSTLPGSQEFVDRSGRELCGRDRRLPTLTSLGLRSWQEARVDHQDIVLEACRTYFRGRPRKRWFAALEHLLLAAGTSLANPRPGACHIHLIPFALTRPWTKVGARERSELCRAAGSHVAQALKGSSIRVLFLGGRSAVNLFQQLAGTTLEGQGQESWDLHGRRGVYARGEAFRGTITSVSGTDLGREVLVLGMNHNPHTSFGLNGKVLASMAEWMKAAIQKDRLLR